MELYIYDILFHILFHYGLSQDVEYSSLCYTGRPCLSVLKMSLHLLTSNSQSIPPPLLTHFATTSLVSVYFCFVDKFIYVIF